MRMNRDDLQSENYTLKKEVERLRDEIRGCGNHLSPEFLNEQIKEWKRKFEIAREVAIENLETIYGEFKTEDFSKDDVVKDTDEEIERRMKGEK